MSIPPEMADRIEPAKAFMAQLNQQPLENIVLALEHTKARFLEELDGLSPEQIAFKPDPERWNIREVALHVSHAMRVVGTVSAMLGAGQLPADRPKGQPGLLDEDPGEWDKILAMVAEGFDTVLNTARSADDVSHPHETMEHPWFGPLTCREWAVFNVLHGNVHVEQLQKNKSAEGYPA